MQRRLFLFAGAATVAAPGLRAKVLPSKGVQIVVGFPPGGGTDLMARAVAPHLSALWKLPVTVENMSGAAGTQAAEYVARQAPDGATLLMAHINSHALAPAMGVKLGYDPKVAFEPIGLVAVTPNLLICNPSQPARTVKALVAHCKANPGKVSFASAGDGSAQHFALEMFRQQAKIAAQHVPYRGSGPALKDLLGGQVSYCFETMASAAPHVKSGAVVALAQTRLKRSRSLPDVPTMAEEGYPFEATVWYGLVGPAQMPRALVQHINEDLNKALAMPDVRQKLEASGGEDSGGSAEKFAHFIAAEQQKWSKLAKTAGIRADS